MLSVGASQISQEITLILLPQNFENVKSIFGESSVKFALFGALIVAIRLMFLSDRPLLDIAIPDFCIFKSYVSLACKMNHKIPRDNGVITADNQGAILAIATRFPLAIMTLTVITKLAIKFSVRRVFQFEDFLIIITWIFGLGQSVAVSIAINDGLGQREASLSADSITSIEKAQYAASVLFILTIGLAKLAILQLLRGLVVRKIHAKILKVTMYVVIAWIVPGFWVLAFQCGAFQPWNTESGQCINQFAFWVAMSPVDIMIEIVVILLPIWMMMPVQIAIGKKVTVVVAFAVRAAVIATTIVRLVLLKSFYESPDMIFDSVASGIATQCLISISITSACLLPLKSVSGAFDFGMVANPVKPGDTQPSLNSYEMNISRSSGHPSSGRPPYLDSKDRNKGRGYETTVESRRPGSADSRKSDSMIINRTDQWDIRYDDSHSQSVERPGGGSEHSA